MPNYKEIARLKVAGQSNRAIADFLGLNIPRYKYHQSTTSILAIHG